MMQDQDEKHVSLREMAQRSVEISFEHFDRPNADIVPELTWRAGYEDRPLGLMALAVDLDTDDQKQAIADLMACHLAAQQAIEATFAHTIWAIEAESIEEWEALGCPAPADFAGHIEQIFLYHFSPDGEALYRATITRYPDKPPELGEWKLEEHGRAVGLFRTCIRSGVLLGSKMPDAMAATFRKDMDDRGPDEVLAEMVASYSAARRMAKKEAGL